MILTRPRGGAAAGGRWRFPGLEDETLLTFYARWTEQRMSCPLRRREGSGYMKPTDAALAKANEDALAKLRAERAALDARLATAYGPSDSGQAQGKKEEKPAPQPQRYKMSGD
jgi:hypothetical protein